MLKKLALSVAFLALSAGTVQAMGREQVRAVGSSTVYPFMTAAAEEFGKAGKFKTPIVEATGTGGGIKLFCSGADVQTPDLANASRAIKPSEVELCKSNGVRDIVELKLGYDGIVLANSTKAVHYKLTKEQIFLALARKVPQKGKLVDNFYQNWSQIDSSLPNAKIEVYGPPPSSGTRDAFVEMVMDKACTSFSEFGKAAKNPDELMKLCQQIREDGKFIEAGENDNLIVQKLNANPQALGIFGYSFLDQNRETVQASSIGGVEATMENISTGKYPVARLLYVYFKKEHLSMVPGLKEFLAELTSDNAIGDEGYLTFKGLVPLHPDDLKAVQAAVAGIK